MKKHDGSPGDRLSYAEKLKRANKEALWALLGFAVIVAAWIISGFGLEGIDARIFSTPVWVVAGLFVPWLVAIAVVLVYVRFVSQDFSFDDEDEDTEGVGVADTAATSAASAASDATTNTTAKEADHD